MNVAFPSQAAQGAFTPPPNFHTPQAPRSTLKGRMPSLRFAHGKLAKSRRRRQGSRHSWLDRALFLQSFFCSGLEVVFFAALSALGTVTVSFGPRSPAKTATSRCGSSGVALQTRRCIALVIILCVHALRGPRNLHRAEPLPLPLPSPVFTSARVSIIYPLSLLVVFFPSRRVLCAPC